MGSLIPNRRVSCSGSPPLAWASSSSRSARRSRRALPQADQPDIDIAGADLVLAIIGWLVITCGEVRHVRNRVTRPADRRLRRGHERTPARKQPQLRGMT